jgi:group I intron endonuclease
MIIYQITNNLNGKVYVGQHCGDSDARWRQHLAEAMNVENPLPLYRAFRKYGMENFTYEILEEIPLSKGPEFLNQREIFWIKEKRSFIGDNGYNLTRGGQGVVSYYCSTKRSEKLSDSLDKKNYGQYDPNTGKLIKIWDKSKDLKDNGFWPAHVNKASCYHTGKQTVTSGGKKYCKTVKGYMWLVLDNGEKFPEFITPLGTRESGNYGKTRKGKSMAQTFENDEISQYSLSGFLIDTYPHNLTQVAKTTGISIHSISNALKGKQRIGAGYQWRIFPKGQSPDKIDSELTQSQIQFSKRELTTKPVIKKMDDREIFIYKSVVDAVLDNNVKPTEIMLSIQDGSQDSNGFNWEWKP